MILAAAACAEGDDAPPPPELVAYWKLKEYGLPPRTGGQDAQPAGLLEKMSAVGNVYYAWKAWTQAPKKATWMKEHPDQWKTCQKVYELRREHGAP